MSATNWLLVIALVLLVLSPRILIALIGRAQAERKHRQYVRLRPRIGMERKDKER